MMDRNKIIKFIKWFMESFAMGTIFFLLAGFIEAVMLPLLLKWDFFIINIIFILLLGSIINFIHTLLKL